MSRALAIACVAAGACGAPSAAKPRAAASDFVQLEPNDLEPTQLGPIADAGPIDRTDFEQALAHHRGWIARCHDAALAAHPEIGDWLDVQLTIGATGFVVTTSWAAVDAEVVECLRPVPGDLRFPAVPPGEVVVVHYPFLFIPR